MFKRLPQSHVIREVPKTASSLTKTIRLGLNQIEAAITETMQELQGKIDHLKSKAIPGILWADQYQLTMAQAFYYENKQLGKTDEYASCELYFRKNPFEGGYAVACGLHDLIEHLNNLHCDPEAIEYLRGLKAHNGTPIFTEDFLSHLSTFKFSCSVWGVPDGTIVFANEPIVRIEGLAWQVQMIESALLNMMSQTLIATKASRMKTVCKEKKLLEFGLRRAQSEMALKLSYAAHVGGADATSNLAAGYAFDAATSGTFGHVWVMMHGGPENELTAFRNFAESCPDNATFLVDTFDSIAGALKAIVVIKELEEKGHHPFGIRLDSGDLAVLSKQIREMLDAAGLSHIKIVATNDLNEKLIQSLEAQGACIDVYGVGTNLITGGTQPALGCVYKVTATKPSPEAAWVGTMKISESSEKTTTPGRKGIRRFYDENGLAIADAIYDIDQEAEYLARGEKLPPEAYQIINPRNPANLTTITSVLNITEKELLKPIFAEGELVYTKPRDVARARQRATEERASFSEGVLRLENPEVYSANITQLVMKKKLAMMEQIKAVQPQQSHAHASLAVQSEIIAKSFKTEERALLESMLEKLKANEEAKRVAASISSQSSTLNRSYSGSGRPYDSDEDDDLSSKKRRDGGFSFLGKREPQEESSGHESFLEKKRR